jgi:hypothetical protein
MSKLKMPVGFVDVRSQARGTVTQCVFWIVRMYLRAAARTFRLHHHNFTHGLHLTLRITNDL